MYAIYESYVHLKEAWNDLGSMSKSGLNSGVNQTAAINDNITKNTLSVGVRPTTDQGIAFGDRPDNEEVAAPKEILKLIDSLKRCAYKGDYSGIVVDCMRLDKLAKAHIKN